MPAERHVDVLVVGGGPAGLSAAVVLARSRRDVLVVDAGEPRNAAAPHVHGYLGLDGITPHDLTARGRAEAARYGVGLHRARVVDLARDDDALVATTDDGLTVRARRVVVATGLRDVLPPVPGLAERWGRDVLHCPYCHGWEVRGRRLAVHVTSVADVAKTWTVRRWSDDVVLLLDDVPSDALDPIARRRAEVLGVPVRTGTVAGLVVGEDDALTGVRLADGEVVPCDALVVQPRLEACDDLLVRAGAAVEAGEFGEVVRTDATGATGVPGVWAAGNVTEPQSQVVMAAADGYRAGLAVDHDLGLEDVDRLLARAAAPGRARGGARPVDARRPSAEP